MLSEKTFPELTSLLSDNSSFTGSVPSSESDGLVTRDASRVQHFAVHHHKEEQRLVLLRKSQTPKPI